MDFIQRIALLFLFSIPAFLPNTAHADYSATIIFWKLFPAHEQTSKFSTSQLACSHDISLHPASDAPYTLQNNGDGNCVFTDKYGQSRNHTPAKYKTCNGVDYAWAAAPGNGLCAGTYTPSCTAPLVLDTATNTCVDPCAPKANQPESYFSNTAGGGDSCVGGCVVRMDSGDCGSNTAGQTGCFYDGHYTGTSCTGSESGQSSTEEEAPNSPEYDCVKQGKSWGTVNGTVVCVAAGTSGSSPTTNYAPSTSTSSSNSTTSNGSTTTTSSDSSGTKQTTFNDDGTVTTTESTNTTNSDGTQSTNQTEHTEPVADFCRDNPNVQQCKAADKGSFGGSCDAGFTCDGDAAQCAIAREIHTRNCEIFKEDADMTNKFNEAKNDNGSTNPAATANIQTVNIPTTLDATSPYAGQCNQDVTVSIAGSSVTIPFSAWCDVLNALGYLFLACAYISAAIILGGAV